MYVFTALALVAAIAAVIDVRRRYRPRHPVFGAVLSLFSALPPLLWFIAGWGIADSGEFKYLRDPYRTTYDIVAAAAFFSMIGALIAAVIGLTSIAGAANPSHQRLAAYALSVPALLVSLAYGVPPAIAAIHHDATAIPRVYFDAAYQIGAPCAILCVILLVMALAMPSRPDPMPPN